MRSEMIWAYMIQLGENMWGDTTTVDQPPFHRVPFHPTLGTDDAVWRQVIDFLPAQGFNTIVIDIGDAILYESHPEISIRGAWSKDKLKQELDHMRAIGLTPIPKLNFSAGHDAWMGIYARMVSTPQYYQVCEDLIKEVAELFSYPELFHLGMDEETAKMQAGYEFCCVRQQDLWWHDLFFLFDCCQKVGARPWVWADACWSCYGHQELYLKKMPKSVLQSNWVYARMTRNEDGSFRDCEYEAYLTLDQAGFEQVPTVSTWQGRMENAKVTMELARSSFAPERTKGFMTAPWQFTHSDMLYALLNDAYCFGQGKRAVYPEEFQRT